MKQFVAAIFGLHRGERGLALLMAFYHFLLLNTLYLLKPVRDSLFLSERGALELPYVFMLTTVAVLPVALVHGWAGRRLPLGSLIGSVTAILVVNLLGLRYLVQFEAAWVYYLLYVWVSIYAVLITSQFWLLANAVFDAAEAKRVFALLSLGAIAGSVTGGELTGLLVDDLGLSTENLLLLCAALLAATLGLVKYIRYRSYRRSDVTVSEAHEAPPAPGLRGIWSTLRSSRHLLLIVGVIALTVTATTLIDYQFKTVAAAAHPTEQALTSFMGRFYGRVSLVALVLQVLLAPRLIRIVGVGGALSLLPLGLALGSAALLVFPGLVAATALRGIDQSLKHSVDRTGRELLFVPVDLDKKKRVKVFIDLFVDQGMQGAGGALLLFFTLVIGLSVQQMSVVVLALLGGWIALVVMARSSYINQFRTMLREQDDEEQDGDEERAQRRMSFNEMVASLRSRSTVQVLEALDQLRACKRLPVAALERLLDHRSSRVRYRALRLLRKRSVEGLQETVTAHLGDADADVRLEAARYLYRQVDGNRLALLQQGVAHEDVGIQAAAIGLLARDGGRREREEVVTEELLRGILQDRRPEAEEGRVQVARLLGTLSDRPYRNALLRQLMEDEAPRVVRQAIESAGYAGDRSFVPQLLCRLQSDAYEEAAQKALSHFDERIIGTLYDHMVDASVDDDIRRRVPPILAAVGTRDAVNVLLLSLDRVSVPVRHAVVRALSDLRANGAALDADEGHLSRGIEEEARRYGALGQALQVRRRTDERAAAAVPEEVLILAQAQALERLFRLLGLRYSQDDIYYAYRGFTGDEQVLRASAIEFLDNLLDWDTKKFVLPLLDGPAGRNVGEVPGGFTRRLRDWPAVLTYLLESNDPRLVMPALRSVAQASVEGKQEPEGVRAAVEAARDGAEPDVRAAAAQVLSGEEPVAEPQDAA